MVSDISNKLQVTTLDNHDGTVSLFTPTGHGLVVGGAVSRLALANDSLDPSKLQVVLISNGERIDLPREGLGNGEFGGLLRFRDEDLAAVRANLGQIAAGVAWAYNRQQSLGIDSTGAAGAAIFQMGTPIVTQATDNTGDASFAVSVVDGALLEASDYSIGFDGATYTMTRLSDGTTTTSATWPVTIDGLQIGQSGGTAQAGDRFLLRAGSVYAAQFETTGISPMRLATGLAATASTGAANAGDVTPASFSVVASDPNVAAPVTITFDGAGTFSVSGTGTGNPTGLAYTPGMTIQYNGWSMKLTGSPAAGDTLSVTPTTDPAVDNRNARAMLALGDSGIVGGASVSNAYSNMLGDMGLRTQTAQGSAEMSLQRLADAKASVAEVSGVNLDEEAARLLQFQQAYQAAAKLMATAQTIFETLLQMTR